MGILELKKTLKQATDKLHKNTDYVHVVLALIFLLGGI